MPRAEKGVKEEVYSSLLGKRSAGCRKPQDPDCAERTWRAKEAEPRSYPATGKGA